MTPTPNGSHAAARRRAALHPVVVLLSRHLERLRVARGWEHRQIARRLGVNPVTYGSWERGDRQIKTDRLPALAAIYGLTPPDLLDPFVVAFREADLRRAA